MTLASHTSLLGLSQLLRASYDGADLARPCYYSTPLTYFRRATLRLRCLSCACVVLHLGLHTAHSAWAYKLPAMTILFVLF